MFFNFINIYSFLLVFASLINASEISECAIHRVAENAYAGKGRATSGEPIYFGMQMITESNQADLEMFIRATSRLTAERSPIECLTAYCNPERRAEFKILYDFDGDNERFSRFGFSNSEMDTVLDLLSIGKFYGSSKGQMIFGGGLLKYMNTNIGSYFAYVSKYPVTGARFFGITHEDVSLKKYLDKNQDLIMLVGSVPCPSLDYYYNRGIARSLYSMIYDDSKFKGTSLALHGFTAAVMHSLYPNINCMAVAAVKTMADILMKALADSRKSYSVQEDPEFKKLPSEANGLDFPMEIKIDWLISKYRG